MTIVGRVSRRFTLYRWYDAAGTLLYVGQSVSVWERVTAHRRDSPFYAEAATMTLEDRPTSAALDEAERIAIQTEHPLYNVTYAVPGDPRKIIVHAAGDRWVRLGGPDAPAERWIAHDVFEDGVPGDGELIRVLGPDGELRLQGIVDGAEEDTDEDDFRIVVVWVFGECFERPRPEVTGYHQFSIYFDDEVEVWYSRDWAASEVVKRAMRTYDAALRTYWDDVRRWSVLIRG